MSPLLPIALLAGAFILLRKPAKTSSQASGEGGEGGEGAPGGRGPGGLPTLGLAGSQKAKAKAEFRRRKELDALLKRRAQSAAAPAEVEIPAGLKPCLDEGISAELLAELIAAWNSTTLSPLNYAEIAATLTESGFAKAAACLAKRADEELAKKGGLPHTIRSGDIPSLLATYYTGDAARFRELGKLNPQLGKLITTNGVTNYAKWIVGTDILIPAAWKPLSKPVPPLAAEAPKDAAFQPPTGR